MELKAKLYLVDEEGEKYMGIGVLWLLDAVAKKGSLRAGAQSLGISYSKAFGMVKHLEDELGRSVLERKRGGSDRQGASLTPFGKSFMACYDSFQREAKAAMQEPYARFQKQVNELLRATEGAQSGN